MVAWFMIGHLFKTLLAWLQIGRLAEQDKDLEILLLRQQLAILERRMDKPVRITKVEKLTLTVLTAKFKAVTQQSSARLRETIRLFQPETVLKWHRELVRRKWTFHQPNRGGRTRTNTEIEALIVRFVKENADWGMANSKVSYASWATPSVSRRLPISSIAAAFRQPYSASRP